MPPPRPRIAAAKPPLGVSGPLPPFDSDPARLIHRCGAPAFTSGAVHSLAVMALSTAFVDELRAIVGKDAVVVSVEGRMTYECDMHTFYKGAPDVVVLPTRTEQVQAIVQACLHAKVPIVPRGSGTGLIGGAMAPQGGVMVGLNRMASILEIDYP